MNTLISRTLAGALIFFGSVAPSFAESKQVDALKEAHNLESSGQFVMAAGAYLAIIDDYDFLPGTDNSSFTKEQKIQMGRRAVNCLQQSARLNNKSDGFEAELLGAAGHTMMVLEPRNPYWAYICACTQIEKRNYAEANRLLNECISNSGSDPTTLRQALQTRNRLRISSAAVLAQSK